MIHRNRELGHMTAQCDACFDVVDFDYLDGSESEHWGDVRQALDIDNWQSKKVNGKWQNICPDCV